MNPAPQIAYLIRIVYPDPTAAALQSIRMAAALAQFVPDTQFYVHDLIGDQADIFARYGITRSQLKIRPMGSRNWPQFLYGNALRRSLTFNSLVGLDLSANRSWHNKNIERIVFIRSYLEALYWGLLRPYAWWTKDWVFVYEAHDLLVASSEDSKRRMQRMFKNFDLVLAVTQGLADDIREFTEEQVQPHVLRLCSGLARLDHAPVVNLDKEEIVLGYFGSIDKLHGVDDLIMAMRFLPQHFKLRIVGEVFAGAQTLYEATLADPQLAQRVEFRPRIDYHLVADAMAGCDILLLPGGGNPHSQRYRSPLKLFDYMVRGKPILAADVPAHREVIRDHETAILYPVGQPEALASQVEGLVEQSAKAAEIAERAWLESARYTYEARAIAILQLVEHSASSRG